MTDLASVLNQVEVKGKLFASGDEWLDERVCLRVAAFFGQPFQAAQDAKNMRVHRKDRLGTGEEQDTARRLWPDAFQREQKGHRFCRRNLLKKRQAQVAAPRFDFIENCFDDDGFDVRQATGLDRGSNGRGLRTAGLFPSWEPLFQTGESPLAVHVGRGLRQDRGNEFIQRVKLFKWGRAAVGGFEMLGDIVELLWWFGQGEI